DKATMIEADGSWLEQAKRISAHSPFEAARSARWMRSDLLAGLPMQPTETYDLVVISYTLGELSQADAEKVIRQAWASTQKFLVILEPGTRRGFRFINTVRSWLIASGAHLLAPSPHASAYPIEAARE